MSVFQFPRAPDDVLSAEPSAIQRAVRQVCKVLNSVLSGKLNAVVEVTLADGATSTVLTDARLTIGSFLDFDPMTANAATEKANGTLYVASADRANGQVTITHANNSQTDRTFKVLIIG